jgi:hypothetical protein
MSTFHVPTAADLSCHCLKHEPHSIIKSPVAAVWQLVAAHPTLRRCELQRVAEAAGINKWTARTQIQAALKAQRGTMTEQEEDQAALEMVQAS